MEIKGAVEIGCGQTMKRLKCFGLYPEGIRGYGMVSGMSQLIEWKLNEGRKKGWGKKVGQEVHYNCFNH